MFSVVAPKVREGITEDRRADQPWWTKNDPDGKLYNLIQGNDSFLEAFIAGAKTIGDRLFFPEEEDVFAFNERLKGIAGQAGVRMDVLADLYKSNPKDLEEKLREADFPGIAESLETYIAATATHLPEYTDAPVVSQPSLSR